MVSGHDASRTSSLRGRCWRSRRRSHPGRLLARFGPARFVPFILAVSAALFLVEWSLLGGYPRAVSALVYFHASVLGAIGISAFWSLLNERFDPHSAKPLMARVAAAGAFGGLAGGVGAERVTALLSQGAVLRSLACRAPRAWRAPCSSGAAWPRGGTTGGDRKTAGADGPRSGACHCFAISPWWSRSPRRSRPLVDYLLKAEVVAGLARASRSCVSSASSMPGRPSPRSCCRPRSAARSSLGSDSAAR